MTAQEFDRLKDVWESDDPECVEDYPITSPLERGDLVHVYTTTTNPYQHRPYERPARRWTPGMVINPTHLEWDANGYPIEGVLVQFRDGWKFNDRAGKFVPVCRTAVIEALCVVLFRKAADAAEAETAA